MKNSLRVLVLISSLVVTYSASAKTIARIVVGGGMPAPGICQSSAINVDDSGLVQLQSCKKPLVIIATLAPNSVAKVASEVSSISISDLTKPPQFGCEDAPSTLYQISTDGQNFQSIAGRIDCNDVQMVNMPNEALDLLQILKGFEVLGNL